MTDLKALNEQALAALHQGALTEAQGLIDQLSRLRPGHPQLVMLTGMLRGRQDRHEEAARLLEAAAGVRPGIWMVGDVVTRGLGRLGDRAG